MDLRLLVLALGTFAIGTGTFIVTGLLGTLAEDLSVSVGAAGQLVTVFAIAYALGSPVLVVVTGRVARRRLLVGVLAVFALANLMAAVAPTFGLLMAARVVAALGAAVCTPVSGAVAADLASPEMKGRALSLVLGGLSVAWAVGIPLGTLVGDLYGWRASFVLVGILGAAAAAGVGMLLPDIENPPAVGLGSRLRIIGHAPVLIALSLTVLGVMAGFVVLTYLGPLLEDLTSFGGRGVSGLLLVFGLTSVAGTALGGYVADRLGPIRSLTAILAVLVLSLFSFSLLSEVADSLLAVLGTGTALVAWSLAGFALIPLQQYRLIALSPGAQNEALSLNASAIYLGQGMGAGLGGLTLGYGSLATLGWVGALCAAFALFVLIIGARK